MLYVSILNIENNIIVTLQVFYSLMSNMKLTEDPLLKKS